MRSDLSDFLHGFEAFCGICFPGFPPKPPPEGGRGTGMPYIRTSGMISPS